ncbi:hypothetical protein ACHQM5_013177 [Ranunculus cassubicifolius]
MTIFFRSGCSEMDDLELPLYKKRDDLEFYNFDIIKKATNNFSTENKLGEGGFGSVYKGVLDKGEEIAVKKLSKYSIQGIDEFKNEVKLISKLQHNNLVRILGCCIQGEEKILVYEHMKNKSLDSFIFGADSTKGKFLDWGIRFQIILGVARGLLYLHHDSRLKIIHRDLKTSNVLLDHEMVPKISDFGLARIFGGNQVEARTKRVFGTRGYMAPEYVLDGRFSVKSDVFSFGVMILEIISGKRNRCFSYVGHQLNLLGHAWRLWSEDKAMELVDESISHSCSIQDVQRCIHVALLCVQKCMMLRPKMSCVVVMLSSETAVLPKPQLPGFYVERSSPPIEEKPCCNDKEGYLSNEATITFVIDDFGLPLSTINDDLVLYDLTAITTATNNFSDENKLGEGGFGSVYKGTLNGEEVAVKRLSKFSIQGIDEFKNEIKLISKLQHKNLVRILGCCVQGEEKMLVYEYLENKSLDLLLCVRNRWSLLSEV